MLFFSVFVICLIIGIPIAFAMGIAGLIYLPLNGVPLTGIVQRIFGGVDSFTLLAVPLYLLADFPH